MCPYSFPITEADLMRERHHAFVSQEAEGREQTLDVSPRGKREALPLEGKRKALPVG